MTLPPIIILRIARFPLFSLVSPDIRHKQSFFETHADTVTAASDTRLPGSQKYTRLPWIRVRQLNVSTLSASISASLRICARGGASSVSHCKASKFSMRSISSKGQVKKNDVCESSSNTFL